LKFLGHTFIELAVVKNSRYTVKFFYIYIAPDEITEDNFEDLLAYDDVLLDYFNAFLCLPVSF